MKILGIDSSGMVASAAIVTDNVTTAEYSVNFKKTHSETLLPMVDEILTMTDTHLDELDAIALAVGPGSFTGLRIGAATVKGLAMAAEKPVVPVPTLDALAYNLWGTDKLVCPIMDARRNQVYTGIYSFENGVLRAHTEQLALDIAELAEQLNALGRPVIFTGDGCPVFEEQLKTLMKTEFSFAPAQMNRQRAASVAALGAIYYAEGRSENADEMKPVYLRKSQAEREREEGKGTYYES